MFDRFYDKTFILLGSISIGPILRASMLQNLSQQGDWKIYIENKFLYIYFHIHCAAPPGGGIYAHGSLSQNRFS